ncbi:MULTISPECIES: triphosphoribosyl-dephospho-CoA synthase [unclassified Halorubrum]|uniref:triphosphoribosyl-dephospho-CoA synthase n=1 Tax=unclassified Halorubrum TaxID=2642239 RepID=UPI0010F50068|nr:MULTISPECIES: triphosphoribosyl-dephospho-CoA synthase [unclassified Halorubrum]TKX42986.1 triphosphoribosyl-dephospho-CoA synthase [Halorubrum sp. ARQ200]TKX50486.1 triphosphoribosyl-dephospho-CoA synthase [Halorubrum sp. ASP121]
MTDPVDDATLALLVEVAGTPKPGNVDRRRDLDDLRFEAFLGGAVGARPGLERAARGTAGGAGPAVGDAFERAVRGMADRAGTNTQFGCLLLLVPLVRAAADPDRDLSPAGLDALCRATTVEDAVAFYRAFEVVDVAVDDPPPGADDLDVRRGSDAEPAIRDRGATLRDVLALSADPTGGAGDGDGAADRVPDRNAAEWAEGFPRTFRAAEWILSDEGPLADRAARAFLGLLAAEPDTLVASTQGAATAREASGRAAALLGVDSAGPGGVGGVDAVPTDAVHGADLDAAESLADEFVAAGINPGTTADLTCAALFVALRRGAEVAP